MRLINGIVATLTVVALFLFAVAGYSFTTSSTRRTSPRPSRLDAIEAHSFKDPRGATFNCSTNGRHASFDHVTIRVAPHGLTDWGRGIYAATYIDANRSGPWAGVRFRRTFSLADGQFPDYLCLVGEPGRPGPIVLVASSGDTGGSAETFQALIPNAADGSLEVRPLTMPDTEQVSFADLDGTFTVLTGNSTVQGGWTDVASFVAPLLIEQLHDLHWVNITADYPGLVADDASELWPLATHPGIYENDSALASWMADECLLGNADSSWHTLTRGVLSNQLPGRHEMQPWGASFLESVRTTLVAAHACRPAQLPWPPST